MDCNSKEKIFAVLTDEWKTQWKIMELAGTPFTTTRTALRDLERVGLAERVRKQEVKYIGKYPDYGGGPAHVFWRKRIKEDNIQ